MIKQANARLKPDTESHIYHIESLNVDLPSVTTILGLLDKSGPLMGWAVKTMYEYLVTHQGDLQAGSPMAVFKKAKQHYKEVSQEAMDIGSEVHNLVEVYLKGQKVNGLINERTKKPFDAFLKWQKEYDFELIASEHIIWSEQYKYAGTLDLVCKLNGEIYVIDIKSSKGIYDTHLMQVAAYKEAYEDMENNPANGVGILRLDKLTGEPEFKKYSLDESNKAFEMFLCLCNLWHLKKTNGRLGK